MYNTIKQEWLDALRNPEILQSCGNLVEPIVTPSGSLRSAYCALGVLGLLNGMHGIMLNMQKLWPNTYDEKAKQIMFANDIDALSLPAIAEMIESWPDDYVLQPVITSVQSKQKELASVS